MHYMYSEALDMVCTPQGIYFLALIPNRFSLETNPTQYWKTQSDVGFTLSVLLFSHNLALLEIDGRLVSLLKQRTYHGVIPRRLFQVKTLQDTITADPNARQSHLFMVGERPEKSGLYYFVLKDEDSLENPSMIICLSSNCLRCGRTNPSYCLECDPSVPHSILSYGQCITAASVSADFTAISVTDTVSNLDHRVKCNPTCQECDPTDFTVCTLCRAGFTLTSANTCKCTAGFLTPTYTCDPQCSYPFTAQLLSTCIPQCPSNAFPLLDFQALSPNPRTQSTPYTIQDSLIFRGTSRNLELPLTQTLLPSDFTFSFWLMLIDDQLGTIATSSGFDILSYGSRVFVFANKTMGSQFTLSVRLDQDAPLSVTLTDSTNFLTANIWRKVSFSLRSTRVKGLHDFMGYFSSNVVGAMSGYANLLVDLAGLKLDPFSGKIIVGGVRERGRFPGTVREVVVIGENHDVGQMRADEMRGYRGYGLDPYHKLLVYYQLDVIQIYNYPNLTTQSKVITAYVFSDTSSNSGLNTTQNRSEVFALNAPQLLSITTTLTLQIWNNLANCLQLTYSPQIVTPIVLRGDFLAPQLQGLRVLNDGDGLSGVSIGATDNIHFCIDKCQQCQDSIASINIEAITPTQTYWNIQTAKPARFLPPGQHYHLCYNLGLRLLDIGQIYVIAPVAQIYPLNRGVLVNRFITFTTGDRSVFQDADQAFKDRIVFSAGGNCSRIEMPIDGNGLTYREFQRMFNGSYNWDQFMQKGRFAVCWQPAATTIYTTNPLPTILENQFIQVNDFDFFFAVHILEIADNLAPAIIGLNEQYVDYNLKGQPFQAGDKFRFFASNPQNSPCFIANRKGADEIELFNLRPDGTPFFAPVWFGYRTGVNGIISDVELNNYDNKLHMCYTELAEINDGPTAMRVENYVTNMASYTIKVVRVSVSASNENVHLPEIMKYWVEYAGTMNQSEDIEFKFWPGSNTYIYPSQHPTYAHQKGQIAIRRMALDGSGTLHETGEYIYIHQNLTDRALDLEQKEVKCEYEGGKCGIYLGKQRLNPGEIYQLVLYSYSFMIRDIQPNLPVKKYYLFGSNRGSVQQIYSHLFFVRGWSLDVYEAPFIPNSNEGTFILTLRGKALKYQNSPIRIIHKIGPAGLPITVESKEFETMGINVTFQIKGSSYCSVLKVPQGTVIQGDDLQDDRVIIRDFKLNGCESGNLFMTVNLWRGLPNKLTGDYTHLYVTNMRDVNLGPLGCEKGCLKCNGTTNSCLLCENPALKFHYQGKCFDQCPTEAPNYMSYQSDFNKTTYNAQKCFESCPLGLFPANEIQTDIRLSRPCIKCFDGCQVCNQSEPKVCLQCSGTRLLLNGSCLSWCPDSDLLRNSLMLESDLYYEANYENYTCQFTQMTGSENRSQFLEVHAVPIGYRKAIPIDELTIIKATVTIRRGNLTALYFKQLDPWFSPLTKDTNLTDPAVKRKFAFEGLSTLEWSTAEVRASQAWWQMRSSTFKYQSETQLYRILIKAVNDKGDYGYDIFEFYANRNPFTRELIAISSDRYHNHTAKTLFNITTVNMSIGSAQKGWYNSEDDLSGNRLSYSLHAQTATQRFLIMPSIWQQQSFLVSIPHLSSSIGYLEVDIYVTATDLEGASTQKYMSLKVSNGYTEKERPLQLSSLVQILSNALNESSLTEIVRMQMQIINLMEIGFASPLIPLQSGIICLIDQDCGKGNCIDSLCQCKPGYTGVLCQTTTDEYINSKRAASLIMQAYVVFFSNHTYRDSYTGGDLQYLVMGLKGLLKNLEILSLQQVSYMMDLIEITLFSHTQVTFTYDSAFYEDFYDLIGRLLSKINFQWILYSKSDEYYKSDFELVNKISSQTRSCLERFSNNLLLKMNAVIFNEYNYPFEKATFSSEYIQDQYLEVKLFQKSGLDLINLGNDTYEIRMDDTGLYSYQVNIPAHAFFEDGERRILKETEFRFKYIVYRLNPFPGIMLEGPYTVFEVYDANMVPLEINLSRNITFPVNEINMKQGAFNLTRELLQIQSPYTSIRGLPQEYLSCKRFDNAAFVRNGDCGPVTYTPSTCLNCSGDLNYTTVAVCYCSKIIPGGIALLYDYPSIGLNNFLEIKQGFYSDSFALVSWTDSMGYQVALGATIAYVIGMVICILVDIKPKKRILFRLMKDLRNIDRYGLPSNSQLETNDDEESKALTEASLEHRKKPSQSKVSPMNSPGRLEDSQNITQQNLLFTDNMNESCTSPGISTVDAKFKGNQYFEGGSSDEEQIPSVQSVRISNEGVSTFEDRKEPQSDNNQPLFKLRLFGRRNLEKKEEQQTIDDTPIPIVEQQPPSDNTGLFQKSNKAKRGNQTQGNFHKVTLVDKPEQSMNKTGLQFRSGPVMKGLEELIKLEEPQKHDEMQIVCEEIAEDDKDQWDAPAVDLDDLLMAKGPEKKKKGVKRKNRITKQEQEVAQQPLAEEEQAQEVESKKDQVKEEVGNTLQEEQPQLEFSNIQDTNQEGEYSSEEVMGKKLARLEAITKSFEPAFQHVTPSIQYQLGRDLTPDLESLIKMEHLLIVPQVQTIPKESTPLSFTQDYGPLDPEEIKQQRKQKEEAERLKLEAKKHRELMVKKAQEKIKELVIAEDLDERHLRVSRYEDIEEELEILQASKQGSVASNFKELLIAGNPFLNLLFTDSLLFPRHARFTLLSIDVLLIWFLAGMYFKNTRSPITLLDHETMSTDAKQIALRESWVSAIIPLANMGISHLLRYLFRVSQARLRYSDNVHGMQVMVGELQKELKLRFFMGYALCVCMIAAEMWYIVNFTSLYGWKVSWIWWYCGCFAFLLRFLLFDPLCCIAIYVMSKVKHSGQISTIVGMKGVQLCQRRYYSIAWEEG